MYKKTDNEDKFSIFNLVLSAIFGVVGGVLTLGIVFLLDQLIELIWGDWLGYDIHDPKKGSAQLIIVLIIGLAIGLLAKKYGSSKGSIETVIEDSLERGVTDWRLALKNVGIGFLSIGSGASLGPEAPGAMLNAGVASFIADKTKMSTKLARALNVSAVSGMLGSLLSSPFIATAMFIDFSKDKIGSLRDEISYTFVAGSFGVVTFFTLLNTTSATSFGIPALQGPPTSMDLLLAFAFGLIGAIFTVIVGLVMRGLESIFVKLDNKLVLRSLLGAAMAGVLAVFLPLTMFSGQHTLTTLINESSALGAGLLFLIAISKLVATSTLIRTGFFGGPIFPAIFAGAALGLALNTFFNTQDAIAIAATVSGILVVSLKRPLSAAIIAVAMTGVANTTLVAVAVSAGLLIVYALERVKTNE